MPEDSIPVKSLSKKQMQDLFRDRNFSEKIKNKELTELVYRERHANPLTSGQPFCSYSQLLSYHDVEGTEIMRAHRYMKDRKIGASGIPDPFRIFIDGIVYKRV